MRTALLVEFHDSTCHWILAELAYSRSRQNASISPKCELHNFSCCPPVAWRLTRCHTCRFNVVKDALNFCVAIIVAAIPLALEIVVTSTLALGSRKLAAEGAIVTRLAAIEDLSGMNILCSDKTGVSTAATGGVLCQCLS